MITIRLTDNQRQLLDNKDSLISVDCVDENSFKETLEVFIYECLATCHFDTLSTIICRQSDVVKMWHLVREILDDTLGNEVAYQEDLRERRFNFPSGHTILLTTTDEDVLQEPLNWMYGCVLGHTCSLVPLEEGAWYWIQSRQRRVEFFDQGIQPKLYQLLRSKLC